MIELPTKRRDVQNYNPKLLVLFGRPKSGKSSLMASLDSNLIIDLEDGYRALSVMSVNVHNAQEIFEVANAVDAKIKEERKFPYRFITIDNVNFLTYPSIDFCHLSFANTH